jgi:predicted translin family RNA/ssDNA-binding protein
MLARQRTRFTAYITKYALTHGIFEREVEDCFEISSTMVKDCKNSHNTYHRGEWHRSKDEAVAKAEAMRRKKIASLQASMKKLSDLKF